MIVHVASFLESLGGSIDKDHYLRPIPGRVGYAAYCRKPEYSKEKKKEMAAHAVVQNFRSINAEACAILRDPEQKSLWQEKHLQALRELAGISVCPKPMANHQYLPDYTITSSTNSLSPASNRDFVKFV